MSFSYKEHDFTKFIYEFRSNKYNNLLDRREKYSTEARHWFFSDFKGDVNEIQGEWIQGEITVSGHRYDIQINFGGPRETPILIKPIKKYENYEFEQIFGFSGHCQNWDSEKIVSIRKRNGSEATVNAVVITRMVQEDEENEDNEYNEYNEEGIAEPMELA